MSTKTGDHQIEDPLERVRFVHEEAVNSKALTNAVGARKLIEYPKLVPSVLAGLGARLYARIGAANAHAPVFDAFVSNVSGPRVPLYFCGAQMLTFYGTGPMFDSVGLISTVCSYGDAIAISITADRAMHPDPDPEVYADALRGSFEALGARVGQQSLSALPQQPEPTLIKMSVTKPKEKARWLAM